MNISLFLSTLGFVVVSCCSSVYAAEEDLLKEIDTISAQARAKLEQFRNDQSEESMLSEMRGNQVPAFVEAKRLIDTLEGQWQKSPALVVPKVLELRLDLLSTCFAARNREYDLENPPETCANVSPGFGPGLMPGMDPDQVSDPEVRRKYKEAIAENNRRKAEFARQKELQRCIEDCFYGIRGHLKLSKELGTLKEDMATIRQSVKDKDLMEKLEEDVLASFQETPGKPGEKR